MRKALIILACLWAGAVAGIIDFPDNDRYQRIPIQCAGADSAVVAFSFNGSPYVENVMQIPTEIVPIQIFQFVAPDRDSRDRLIPGHYEGEYFYFVDFFIAGDRVASPDTFRVMVNYDIGGGCGAAPLID